MSDSKKTILIVDDTPANLTLLANLLQEEYDIKVANNGQKALDIVSKTPPDIILLDVMMPELDGWEVCKRLKESSDTARVPVIFLTAKNSVEDEEHGLQLGAVDFISKPFSPSIVLARIKTHLRLQDALENLSAMNADLERRVAEAIEKNRSQEQLMTHQAKMAAMGEMIGAIAHQWRQPLNALGLVIQDIEEAFDFGELDKEYLKDAVGRSQNQIGFMSKTIDDFRNFFKPSREKSRFDINEKIEEVLHILLPQIKSITVDFNKEENALFVYGLANEFKQVVLNIINNAKDALLAARTPDARITITAHPEGEKIRIGVRDNAGGIPEAIIENIFDPYFTTKGENGTGVGLHIAKIIIEEHMDGKLRAENESGGAYFTIELPVVE